MGDERRRGGKCKEGYRKEGRRRKWKTRRRGKGNGKGAGNGIEGGRWEIEKGGTEIERGSGKKGKRSDWTQGKAERKWKQEINHCLQRIH